MPHISEVKYSRRACVTAVRDYYHFLAAMYINDEETYIMEPPLGGWASMSAENMKLLGKDDEVGLLLRQLPNMINTSPTFPHCAPQTYFTDWTTNLFHLGIGMMTLEYIKSHTEASCPNMPAHCVGLTDSWPDSYGATFILDTKFGLMHWLKCPDHLRNDVVRAQVYDHVHSYAAAAAAAAAPGATSTSTSTADQQTELPWLFEAGTWTIVDFFDMLKDLFRSLRFFPVNWYNVYDIADTREEEQDKVHVVLGTFDEYGWPDLQLYRKRDCIPVVERMIEEWDEVRVAAREEEEERGKGKGKERAVEERPTKRTVYPFPETETETGMGMEMEMEMETHGGGGGDGVL